MTMPKRMSCTALSLVGCFVLGACQRDGAPTKHVEDVDSPAAGQEPATAPPTEVRDPPGPAAAGAQPLDPAIFIPHRTRGGQLRLADEGLHDNPAAAGELLRRLDRETSPEMRIALVEALPRTGGDWLDAIVTRLAKEGEPAVRKAMVAILPRAEPAAAVAGILLGLGDADDQVRTEAALVAGSIPADVAARRGLVEPLRKNLADGNGYVRAAAARSLGILGDAGAFDALVPLLGDPASTVRLQTVRALGRIDSARAAQLPTVRSLRADADPKVARAAAALVDQAAD
ncbi:MAG: HEAT repeat domain-containing protein [Deltaproteobacteria bacterium]|nr:HEAT repeat domain-containing protein [Deltaproteobacteria bacterium]